MFCQIFTFECKNHHHSWERLFVFNGELTNVKFLQACKCECRCHTKHLATLFHKSFEYNERTNLRQRCASFKDEILGIGKMVS